VNGGAHAIALFMRSFGRLPYRFTWLSRTPLGVSRPSAAPPGAARAKAVQGSDAASHVSLAEFCHVLYVGMTVGLGETPCCGGCPSPVSLAPSNRSRGVLSGNGCPCSRVDTATLCAQASASRACARTGSHRTWDPQPRTAIAPSLAHDLEPPAQATLCDGSGA